MREPRAFGQDLGDRFSTILEGSRRSMPFLRATPTVGMLLLSCFVMVYYDMFLVENIKLRKFDVFL